MYHVNNPVIENTTFPRKLVAHSFDSEVTDLFKVGVNFKRRISWKACPSASLAETPPGVL